MSSPPIRLDSSTPPRRAPSAPPRALDDGKQSPRSPPAFVGTLVRPSSRNPEYSPSPTSASPELHLPVATRPSAAALTSAAASAAPIERPVPFKTLIKTRFNESIRLLVFSQIDANLAKLSLHNEAMLEMVNHLLDASQSAAPAASPSPTPPEGRPRVSFPDLVHDLRTPLSNISGLLQLLSDPKESADSKLEFFNSLKASFQHIQELIKSLPDHDEGIELRPSQDKPFTIQGLLTSLRELNCANAKKNNATLTLGGSLQDSDMVVGGDLQKLRQVLINFIMNGIHYGKPSDRGPTILQIIADRVSETDTEVNVQFGIRDNGPGVPPKILSLLGKQRYVQGQKEEDETGIESTGLGLFASDKFIRTMGGTLSIDSAPDQGAYFHFTIPLRKGGSLPPSRNTPSPFPVSFSGLGADDDRISRQLHGRTFQRAGCPSPMLVTSGREAVDAFKKNYYDVVVLDMEMGAPPALTGLEAALEIHTYAMEAFKKSPFFIICSGRDAETLSLPAGLKGKVIVKSNTSSNAIIEAINEWAATAL